MGRELRSTLGRALYFLLTNLCWQNTPSVNQKICVGTTQNKRVPHLGHHKSQITNLQLRHTNTNEIWECSNLYSHQVSTPLTGIDHNSYGFFFGLRAMSIFSRWPKYMKNAPLWDASKCIWVPYSETIASVLNLTPPLHFSACSFSVS